MIFEIACAGILLTMFLALARGIMGPTVYDRILGVNMFGTMTVVLIAVLGFMSGRPEFLDIALVYALMNFIAIIAVLKYRDLTHVPADEVAE